MREHSKWSAAMRGFLCVSGCAGLVAALMFATGCAPPDRDADVVARSAASSRSGNGNPCGSPKPCDPDPNPLPGSSDKNCVNCPEECGICPPPGFCGDGECGNSYGETAISCPVDCLLP
jgi:hypothetical protein